MRCESGFTKKACRNSFREFRKRYLRELSRPAASAALNDLYSVAFSHSTVTLIYASKNEEQNNATVLRDLLNGMRKPPTSSGPEKALASGSRNRSRMPPEVAK